MQFNVWRPDHSQNEIEASEARVVEGALLLLKIVVDTNGGGLGGEYVVAAYAPGQWARFEREDA